MVKSRRLHSNLNSPSHNLCEFGKSLNLLWSGFLKGKWEYKLYLNPRWLWKVNELIYVNHWILLHWNHLQCSPLFGLASLLSFWCAFVFFHVCHIAVSYKSSVCSPSGSFLQPEVKKWLQILSWLLNKPINLCKLANLLEPHFPQLGNRDHFCIR